MLGRVERLGLLSGAAVLMEAPDSVCEKEREACTPAIKTAPDELWLKPMVPVPSLLGTGVQTEVQVT